MHIASMLQPKVCDWREGGREGGREGRGGEGRMKGRGGGERRWFILSILSAAKNARSVQENLQKLQRDREFLQQVISDSMSEISSSGTFTGLSVCVRTCHEEKVHMEQTILK